MRWVERYVSLSKTILIHVSSRPSHFPSPFSSVFRSLPQTFFFLILYSFKLVLLSVKRKGCKERKGFEKERKGEEKEKEG